MLILVQTSRIDLSMFQDCGAHWYHSSPVGDFNFFKVMKHSMEVTQKGYEPTIDAWLQEGVIVELGLLINI
jgi:hypothetical protein